MRIIPLSEGAFTIDKTKRFVPFDLERDDLQQRSTGSLLVEIQPFAIVTSEDVVVVDTGLGFRQDGVLQIHRNLAAAGIDPVKVTRVLLSHLHKDHAGGVSGDCFADAIPASNRPLSFPNAQYYVQRRELEYAFEKGPTAYIPEELECLKHSPQVVLLDGDGVIDGYIKYEITGAHCPWHQAFWIVDGGETVFFGGDVAPQLQQMKSRFVAKYDYDGKKAMEFRQRWWKQGQEEHWTFLFYHDVKTPIWRT
ncbi:MAG TPA: MBL fold metallo-hydrolase [Puia sp.]|jgi:glyoxylase-like metal-dependent hydrolase (beta-lactamase superfamily II)|nr:MBL fold metallo-hydrolase [Puia sp.]